MAKQRFDDAAVEQAFDELPDSARDGLLALRSIILDTASTVEGIGRVEETLKWGQPSYLTPETRSGSTIRLGVPKSPDHDYALFVHCQTDLTEQFETNYPGEFDYEGTRALLFKADRPIPVDALKHCIALALTYHARKRWRAGEETEASAPARPVMRPAPAVPPVRADAK